MPVVKLEIQETKSTVLVAKAQASVTITKQPITLTVNQSGITLDAVQSAASVVIQKANVALGITNSVNTITLGNSGPQGIQGIQGETGPSGITSSKGIATLDFGNGSLTAETVVTGYSEITADSVVMAFMRITATPEHLTDDLLVDPIRLAVKDLIAGVGFTIYGEMDNARANGTYRINWIIR